MFEDLPSVMATIAAAFFMSVFLVMQGRRIRASIRRIRKKKLSMAKYRRPITTAQNSAERHSAKAYKTQAITISR